MERIWDSYLDKRDSKVYTNAGFGSSLGLGKRPALLIVDVTYGFTGDRGDSIEDSIKKYPASCGKESWTSIEHIKTVLNTVRQVNYPVYYTIIEGSPTSSNKNVAIKGNIFNHPTLLEGAKGTQVVDELKPAPHEIIISKKKPSAFFGTPLMSYLNAEHVDTVIITGCTTSGCVRASVIDAFSYNFNVIVPEECAFDRGIASHAINLFDMNQKYADVVKTADLLNQIENRGVDR